MGSLHESMRSWDAVETAERIRRGDVSRREVLEAAIARAEAASDLGAVVTETFDRARRERDDARGAFAGVPTFVKDLAPVKGVPTGFGTVASGCPVAKRTDPAVRRLFDVGFVSLGKSATPELGLTGTTESLGMPPCRNPWDRERSSGGSSGGAATLVAAGGVPLAHGSDGGGSIRIPAAWCGLVGLKVTRGRLDMEGSSLLPVNVAVNGCLSRTVRDTVAFWAALEARHPNRALAPIGAVDAAPSSSLRVGMYVDSPVGDVHPDHVRVVEETGQLLESLGHHVEPITCPFDRTVNEDFMTYWGLLAWSQTKGGKVMMGRSFDASKVDGWTRGLARGFTAGFGRFVSAVRRLRRLGEAYHALFHRFDVLLSPTNAQPATPLGYVSPEVPFDTLYERVCETWPYTPIENVVGAPAISLPLGTTEDGLPVGVHFAGAMGQDRLLLSLARSLEVARPWPLTAHA